MKSFQAGPDSKQRPVHDICSRHKVVVEPTECIDKQKHTAVTLIPTIKQQLQSLHPRVCVCVRCRGSVRLWDAVADPALESRGSGAVSDGAL